MLRDYKVKVCGMGYPENILEISKHKPDYMGFIFYDQSKRFVGENFDAELLKKLDASILKVGVFVNQTTRYIEEKVEKFGLSLLQLHGDETVEQCKELKSKGYKIVKVFQVGNDFDFAVIEPFKKYSDFVLLDTKSEGYGGTGKKFDWSILKNYDNEIPLFLSGGIDLDSIDEIKKLEYLNIHALDINSKFETAPGRKDSEKVGLFIQKIRNEIRG